MIQIAPYGPNRVEAVRRFNRRVAATGFAFPERPAAACTLAVEGDEVRGAYLLYPQRFLIRGEPVEVAHYRLPLSEGSVNRAYVGIGLQLLRHALERQVRLYALGMGGSHQPLPRMLAAAGWSLTDVPFYFKIVHPHRFLRGIRALRSSAPRRFALDLAAWTGAGWLVTRLLQRRVRGGGLEVVEGFGAWADVLWNESSSGYGGLAWRDARTLDERYGDARFHRLRVAASGWAVVLDTPMREDRYFGDLRVGTLVDALAVPGRAVEVVQAATAYLERRGVDVVISNQLHRAWGDALRRAGCRRGPSNFVFAASPRLAELAGDASDLHVNRGDGDGPIHL